MTLPDAKDINLDDLASSTFKLGLATSVFACVGCEAESDAEGLCLLGGEAALTHFGWKLSEDPVKFVFNSTESRAAAQMVWFLKLDPSKTSINDMDRIDARFLCGNCPIEPYRRLWDHEVLT